MNEIPERPLFPSFGRKPSRSEMERELERDPFQFSDLSDEIYDEWVDEQLEREWR